MKVMKEILGGSTKRRTPPLDAFSKRLVPRNTATCLTEIKQNLGKVFGASSKFDLPVTMFGHAELIVDIGLGTSPDWVMRPASGFLGGRWCRSWRCPAELCFAIIEKYKKDAKYCKFGLNNMSNVYCNQVCFTAVMTPLVVSILIRILLLKTQCFYEISIILLSNYMIVAHILCTDSNLSSLN